MAKRGALNATASRAFRDILKRRLAELPESRATEEPAGDALDAITRGAAAIAADHVARAQTAIDPAVAKQHLDCALAAMKLAGMERTSANDAGVTIVINEAPDANDAASDQPSGAAPDQPEQAANASAAPVH